MSAHGNNPQPKLDLPLSGGNADYLEALYEQYQDNADSVTPELRHYFAQLSERRADPARHNQIRAELRADLRTRSYGRRASDGAAGTPASGPVMDESAFKKQAAVLQLINAYRFRGHHAARLDPLDLSPRPEVQELQPDFHGLSAADLQTRFTTGSFQAIGTATLGDLLPLLQRIYCGSIGAEYMHITDTAQKRWIQQRLETAAPIELPPLTQRHLYERLSAAAGLEEYLHTKYVGQKRFSLEGSETVIPLLDEVIEHSGQNGVKEIVIGMAHRGRLNILVNIVGKKPAELFQEFEGKKKITNGSGDVKYHLGYSADIETGGEPVHVTLAFNPSHLEIIAPVVEGSVRARQERRLDKTHAQVLPVILHGDSAFAGQGVVMETFNFSQTRGYKTGGTLHLIVNNQIGFTTSDPLDTRSTLYCTDVAKMVQAPIFHVNGDDPEAALFITRMALDFRKTFQKDVVIDLIAFRKHGHNESDEPMATQPVMYQRIRKHPGIVTLYGNRLLQQGVLAEADPKTIRNHYIKQLGGDTLVSRGHARNVDTTFHVDYAPYLDHTWRSAAETRLTPQQLQLLAERLTTLPAGFTLHRSVAKIIEGRRAMMQGQLPCDWGFAETLAYASLVDENYPVRLSGQDSERGTFFHRHVVLHETNSGEKYLPLCHIAPSQADFRVINSTLSEEAVLAFEYGYATSEPRTLVIWEAQFGDFVNGAQVVIDQFIASCEAKWGRLCGLVMFLPHGYDGQGPEHSSARVERFLQLCAEDNMQVCMPSTPAQMFHLLRRQMCRAYRRPLVVFTPKSLLRHKHSVSTLADMTDRGYQLVIDESDPLAGDEKISRVLLCSGKVYFDLLEARREHNITDIAVLRLEQLYPFPTEELKAAFARYPNAHDIVWVQEEPRNQGACSFLLERQTLTQAMRDSQRLRFVARPRSASPAVGSLAKHLEQQQALVHEALNLHRA